MYAIIFHAHQKIDKLAFRHVRELSGHCPAFPDLRSIIYFEGKRGPDATRLKKSKDIDQPWHFVDPFDKSDTELGQQIERHYHALVRALKAANSERAAFEAAWMAHALVDGLTPAHHYPYEKELESLRGETRATRNSMSSRVLVKGETRRDTLKRSLRIVGPKGLLTTHTMFEAGAYMILAPMRLKRQMPSADDIESMMTMGIRAYFQAMAAEVGNFAMFEKFVQTGWTPDLARIVRRELVPRMVNLVTLAWFCALKDSGLVPAEV